MIAAGVCAGLAYTASSAFAPPLNAPYKVAPAFTAVGRQTFTGASRVLMNAAGGTETMVSSTCCTNVEECARYRKKKKGERERKKEKVRALRGE